MGTSRLKFAPDAILITYGEDFNRFNETPGQYEKINKLLDAESKPIPVIYDLGDMALTMDDLMVATKELQDRQDTNPSNHPMAAKAITVTRNSSIRASMKRFAKFGAVGKLQAVAILDEAIDSIQSTSKDTDVCSRLCTVKQHNKRLDK